MPLQKTNPDSLKNNPFDLFGKQWALLTAGTITNYNMMTIGWGTLGILWGKPMASVFVRPSRFTYEFFEKNEMFSITAFPASLKKVLNLCGSKSGRVINKMDIPELTPIESDGAVYFKEATLAILCKKQYYADLNPELIPTEVKTHHYSNNDFHRVYYGEIMQCFSDMDE